MSFCICILTAMLAVYSVGSTESGSSTCSGDFAPVGDQCFHFSDKEKLNHVDAARACRNMTGKLAAPKNPEALHDYLKAHYENASRDYWIDGSDAKVEGVWVYTNGDRIPNNFPWAKGQPDNYGGNQHCIHWYDPSGYDNLSCSSKRYYVCESTFAGESVDYVNYPFYITMVLLICTVLAFSTTVIILRKRLLSLQNCPDPRSHETGNIEHPTPAMELNSSPAALDHYYEEMP